MNISVCILNYNMPKITDALYEQLKELIKIKCNLFVVDNGSTEKMSKYTTDSIYPNTRLTGGMNHCLKISEGYDYVWMLTNDVYFETKNDPLESMLNMIEKDKKIGVIHPSIRKPVPNYAYPWMIYEENKKVDNIPMVDFIAPMYTKKALDANNWEFNKDFLYGWGIDYESCYLTRKAGLKVEVDFNIIATHQTSITYDSGKDKEFKNRSEYYKKAGENMNFVMTKKYGKDWSKLMLGKI